MKALTGLVAAASAAMALGAADTRASGMESYDSASATEENTPSAEDNLVNYLDLAYSGGYVGDMQTLESTGAAGLSITMHFDAAELIPGTPWHAALNFGFNANASLYAFFQENLDTGIMVQGKISPGLELVFDSVSLFLYTGIGFTEIDANGNLMPFFNLNQGLDFNFGSHGDSVKPYLGVEQGLLVNGEDRGYYSFLNLGLKM